MPKVPFLLLLGDASYSVYLAHGFVLGAIRRIWAREFNIELIATHAAFMVLAATASIAAGIGIYIWVERPITGRLTRQAVPGKVVAAAASV